MLHKMLFLTQEFTERDFAELMRQNEVVFQQSGGEAAAVGIAFLLFFMVYMAVILAFTIVVVVIPLWLICKKAGISPYLSLLILVPGVNIAIYWILALINWPNLKPEAERIMYNSSGNNRMPPDA